MIDQGDDVPWERVGLFLLAALIVLGTFSLVAFTSWIVMQAMGMH